MLTGLFAAAVVAVVPPWPATYSNVRDKITDPSYQGWFLKFKPGGGTLPGGAYHVPK
eukprot:gene17753-19303_t